MALKNSEIGWGWLARLFHWTIAAIIFFMIGLGVYMSNFVDDPLAAFPLVQLHKSWGATVFALALLRIIWRLANPSPPLPSGMPAHERFLAHAGHLALYGFMIALPLSGWLMSSASELQDLYQIKNMVFGVIELPDPFVPGDGDLEDLFNLIHFWCAIGLTLVLLGHVGAALKHHFVNRDNVLTRMIIGR